MNWVHVTDRFNDTIVEFQQFKSSLFSGFVERIISCHPWLILIPSRKDFPQFNCPVLIVHQIPEGGMMTWRVGMPVSILTAWDGMQIKDGVDSVCCAKFNHAIEMLESSFIDVEWEQLFFIVQKVTVIERNSQRVHPVVMEEFGVRIHEEVGEELTMRRTDRRDGVLQIQKKHRIFVFQVPQEEPREFGTLEKGIQ